jgi:membrane protein YdbS with pleckstrin-like domain
LDSEKTFVENITRNAKKSIFSSFYPFPRNTSFLTVGKGEIVVLIVRQHWISLLPRAVLAFVALFFPFLMSYSLSSWFESVIGSSFFVIGLFLFFMMVSVTILLDGFLKWFFGLNMITTKRIIDVDFVSIVTHRISETTFDQVQDVSHCPAGPLASFFDYGHLYIQTAAAKSEFEFNNIPRPRDVQDTILDLRELRRKKIAKGD